MELRWNDEIVESLSMDRSVEMGWVDDSFEEPYTACGEWVYTINGREVDEDTYRQVIADLSGVGGE